MISDQYLQNLIFNIFFHLTLVILSAESFLERV